MRLRGPGEGPFKKEAVSSARLACKKLKICATQGTIRQLFDLSSSALGSAADPALHRCPGDFSRGGDLSPELLVTLLLYMVGDGNCRGYRHLLDAFWDECGTHGIPVPRDTPVSAPAFCQAREKISIELLRHVLHDTSDRVEHACPDALWHGRRVLAVDGSKTSLQPSRSLDMHFGRPTGGHCPQATISALFNVCTRAPIDIAVAPYGSCERKLLLEHHLPRLRRGDVLVLDRGYPSHDLLRRLLACDVDFLVRVPESHTFEALDIFRQSGGNDYRVFIAAPKDSPAGTPDLELRAVRLTNKQGEHAYFLTSLRRTHFSRVQISELYHLRWQVEEYYKLIKSPYFGQRQFHARSPHGITQEIFAQAIFVAITRFLMALAATAADASPQDLSPKAGVFALAAYLTRLCLQNQELACKWWPKLAARLTRTRDKRRPGRSCPRRSFKPGPRWGPKGRRGA